jgi:hypothetical protein
MWHANADAQAVYFREAARRAKELFVAFPERALQRSLGLLKRAFLSAEDRLDILLTLAEHQPDDLRVLTGAA